MNLILKYIYCLFIINVYCAEITVTEIKYINNKGYENILYHLHDEEENLGTLGLKCNNSKELLDNIQKLIESGKTIIYSGGHKDKEYDHKECTAVYSNEDKRTLINTLEVIKKTNKFVLYNYKDRMSLYTNDILFHHHFGIIPYSSEYENNYYYENIQKSIIANYSRYQNYPEWDCNDLLVFMKSLETEDNKKLFPDNAEFGFYTKVFDKNGEEKFIEIKNSDKLVNLTNIFVTLPSFYYNDNVEYSDPKEVDFSPHALKPYKIPEKDLIKIKDEIKDEYKGKDKVKLRRRRKKINNNEKLIIPEQKHPNGNRQGKNCCC